MSVLKHEVIEAIAVIEECIKLKGAPGDWNKFEEWAIDKYNLDCHDFVELEE